DELGVVVEEPHPDLSEAPKAFQTLRAAGCTDAHETKLRETPELLKPEIIWNIEKGLKLGMADIIEAETRRGELIRRMNAFFDEYDLLMTPATIVSPYPVEQRYVEECAGVRFDNYIDWLAIAFAVTLTTAPALSLPCGFSREGLPVGLQIVARPRGEARLLSGARQLEEALDLGTVNPIDPRPGK